MKKMFFFLILGLTLQVQAQRVVEKAIIKMNMQITFPENWGGGGPGGGGDDNGMRMMPRDIETAMTVFYKGDQTKIETSSDFGKNYTFIDRKEKKTTTLMEMMGRKQGFYSTDAEAEAMTKRMDSIRALRRDSLEKMGLRFNDGGPEILYTEESKKIAGITCKKAIIKTKDRQGAVTETAVWYAPDFKMGAGFATSGGSQGGGMMRGGMSMNLPGMEKLNGFPMEYETTRQNGMKTYMVVTKVDLDANIDDKTLEIPKGYDIKPMSEMGGQGGGGFRMIMGSQRGGGN
ncbi:MAG: hypothetical protein ACK45S_05045 [Sphingobacteriales bacterium]